MTNETGNVKSFLGNKSSLEGTLTVEGTLTLVGKFKGNIKGGDEVILSEGSESEAAVEAENVVVFGKIMGRIHARRQLLIHSKAQVDADISTPALAIHQGAVYNGKCSMTQEKPKASGEKVVDLQSEWIVKE